MVSNQPPENSNDTVINDKSNENQLNSTKNNSSQPENSSENCENVNRCAICQIESKLRCSNCNFVYYCSAAHQKQDWKQHKQQCHPFIIKSNEKYGRYLVASRNIRAGEIVLKEKALVSGPSQITGPVCIGCMKGLEEDDGHTECDNCGWPICSKECAKIPEHAVECEITKARGKVEISNYISPHPIYQCVTPLRCMLLKKTNPENWSKLIQLESHENIRRGSQQWKIDYEGVAKFIPKFFRTTEFSEDEIMKVTGILQINGHEVPLSEPPYVAIYNQASLIEHSCIPNLTKSFSKRGDVIFWATRSIKKDVNLSICYTDAIWGTAARQNHLLQTKLFKCECSRCKDVTELGTNYGAIKCNKNDCDGLCLPLSLETLNSQWRCLKCQKTLEIAYVTDILDRAGKDLAAMEKGNADHCKRYINHYTKWLPKQHHYICEVKVALAQLIGSGGPEILQSITNDELNKKIELCREQIGLFEKLAPSEARMLGLLCFELHAALAERGRRASTREDDADICTCALEESLEYVEKSINYLQHEPTTLSEGQIYGQAKINRDSLKLVMGLPC
ncbi:SET domain-containing protein SmydA-8 [Condylostylus longicornis]|uniref:SET domain-containing protein SmydA-8 n=1 Tax=Condylostylus longicornis TaxID=2530218 RepID=UPI00244E0DEE|nr:SET domain-containing protein SmydA-8 [Condylostylus longicornis]